MMLPTNASAYAYIFIYFYIKYNIFKKKTILSKTVF